MAEQRDDNHEPAPKRRTSRKVVPLLMLILGLLAGGAGGFFLHRTGILSQAFGLEPSPVPTPTPTPVTESPRPTPTPVTETVTVEVERTPAECLAAIDGLGDAVDDLEGVRRRLMDADMARSGGNQEIANRAYSDVDQGLRAALIALEGETLQAAIEECRAKATEGPSSPSPVTSSPSPAIQSTPDSGAGETPSPTPEETLSPEG